MTTCSRTSNCASRAQGSPQCLAETTPAIYAALMDPHTRLAQHGDDEWSKETYRNSRCSVLTNCIYTYIYIYTYRYVSSVNRAGFIHSWLSKSSQLAGSTISSKRSADLSLWKRLQWLQCCKRRSKTQQHSGIATGSAKYPTISDPPTSRLYRQITALSRSTSWLGASPATASHADTSWKNLKFQNDPLGITWNK